MQTFSLLNPGTNPKGANNFNCKVKPGQLPLILLAGTGEDAFKVWADYAPRFAQLGYCVFTPNLNTATFSESQTYTGDIIGSAEAFSKFVQLVLRATGAPRWTSSATPRVRADYPSPTSSGLTATNT